MKKWISGIFALLCIAYLALIWWDAPNREVIWFILPIAGLFRQIAGTWWKLVGRLGVPIITTMAFWFFLGWSWWLLAVPVAYFAVSTLPVTLVGNSVRTPWYNRLWVFFSGFLKGAAALPFGLATGHVHCVLAFAVVVGLIHGIVINLANFDFSGKYFPWKLDEFITGATSLLPLAMCIDHALMNVI